MLHPWTAASVAPLEKEPVLPRAVGFLGQAAQHLLLPLVLPLTLMCSLLLASRQQAASSRIRQQEQCERANNGLATLMMTRAACGRLKRSQRQQINIQVQGEWRDANADVVVVVAGTNKASGQSQQQSRRVCAEGIAARGLTQLHSTVSRMQRRQQVAN